MSHMWLNGWTNKPNQTRQQEKVRRLKVGNTGHICVPVY